jgi:glycosyltransferase involved in cell wall biosynthesis
MSIEHPRFHNDQEARGPKVSVVLPTHNRADTIARAVHSVLDQTHANLELIVVDDCSGDETLTVLRTIDDARLKVLPLPDRQGVSGARNAGLGMCASHLIAFQDSDDVWMRSKLERQLAVLGSLKREGVRVAGVGCRHTLADRSAQFFDTPASPFGSDPEVSVTDRVGVLAGCLGGDGTPKLLLDLTVGDPTVRFDEGLSAIEDRDFVFRFMTAGSVFAVVEEDLLAVTRGRSDHAANATRSAAAYQRLLDKHSSVLASHPVTRDWYLYLAARQLSASRSVREAFRVLRLVSTQRRWMRTEILLGSAFGQKGLSLAARLRIRPDWRDRCSDRDLRSGLNAGQARESG